MRGIPRAEARGTGQAGMPKDGGALPPAPPTGAQERGEAKGQEGVLFENVFEDDGEQIDNGADCAACDDCNEYLVGDKGQAIE